MGWERNVSIAVYLTAQNTNVEGFGGVVLFTNDVTYATATYKEFTDPDDVVADTEVGTTAQAWAADWFGVSPHGASLIIGKATADAGDVDSTAVLTDLAALKAAMDANGVDGWMLCTTSKTQAVIEKIAEWCAGKKFFPVCVTADSAVKDGTAGNVLLELKDADRKGLYIYHATADEYPDAKITALKSALDTELTGGLGHTRFEYTTVGVTGQDSLTTDEVTAITTPGGSIVQTTAGVTVIADCKGPDGYFPDEHLTADWLDSRLNEAILGLLIREATANRKVGFTKFGFSQIAGSINEVLELCVDTGKASDFTFTPPKRSEVTTSDAENRVYRWSADVTMSGGILTVSGSVYLGR